MSGAPHELALMLAPRSVVILGVGPEEGHPCQRLAGNLAQARYRGAVYLVGRGLDELMGQPVRRELHELEETPELALITSACHRVPEAVKECLARGIRSLIVYSGGFGEAGSEGHFAQSRLAAQVKAANGMLVGPNTPGLMRAYSGLNATLLSDLPVNPNPSPVEKAGAAVVTSSGGLGRMVVRGLEARGVPVTTLIGLGNCADLGAAEWLDYLANDPLTRLVVLLAEGAVPGGRRWLDAAARLVRKKPILVVHGGDTEAGGKAAEAHSGVAATTVALRDLMDQAGLLVAADIPSLVDQAEAHWLQGDLLPSGQGVVILSTSGGAGVLAADYATRQGLELPVPEPSVTARLQRCVPMAGSLRNPIDTTEELREYACAELMDAACSSHQISSALVVSIGLDYPELGFAAERVSSATARPVVMVLDGCPRLEEECRRLGIPVARGVAAGVDMLASLHRRARTLAMQAAVPPAVRRASRVLETELGLAGGSSRRPLMLGSRTFGHRGGVVDPPSPTEPGGPRRSVTLSDDVCRRLLLEYGLPLIEESELRSVRDLEWYVQDQGYPIIVQLRPSREIVRITNDQERLQVLEALRTIDDQQMFLIEPRPPGDRLILTGVNHPEYGSLVELKSFRDALWRFCPPAPAEVASALERLGLEAGPAALEVVERVSGLLCSNSALSRIELDPVVLNPTGATVAGFRAVVSQG